MVVGGFEEQMQTHGIGLVHNAKGRHVSHLDRWRWGTQDHEQTITCWNTKTTKQVYLQAQVCAQRHPRSAATQHFAQSTKCRLHSHDRAINPKRAPTYSSTSWTCMASGALTRASFRVYICASHQHERTRKHQVRCQTVTTSRTNTLPASFLAQRARTRIDDPLAARAGLWPTDVSVAKCPHARTLTTYPGVGAGEEQSLEAAAALATLALSLAPPDSPTWNPTSTPSAAHGVAPTTAS